MALLAQGGLLQTAQNLVDPLSAPFAAPRAVVQILKSCIFDQDEPMEVQESAMDRYIADFNLHESPKV